MRATTATAAAKRGDMVPRPVTGTTEPAYWSIVSEVRGGTAALSRRGAIQYASAEGLSDRVVRKFVLERLTFEGCAELPRPTCCPECMAEGNWNITLDDHDRMWCQDCGHQWEIPLRVMDDADLSVCTGCSVAIVEGNETRCELCIDNKEL